MVFEAPEVGWNAVDWSPDGKSLLLEHFVSANESYLWVYDLATHEKREIEPAKVKAGRGGNFSRDGKGVYIASDLGSEFRTLRYVDLATGKVTPLTDHIKWDIDEFVLSRDGRYLAYIANEDGASRLGVMDLVQHADLIPPKLPFGVIGSLGFDPGGQAARLQPADAERAVRRLGVDARGRRRSSAGRKARSGRSTRRSSSRRRWCTTRPSTRSDGKPREIPAWVYKPVGRGTVSGADQHPRRAGSPGAADVQRRRSSSGPWSSATP